MTTMTTEQNIPTIKFMSLEEYNKIKDDPVFERYTDNMVGYFCQKQLKKQFNTKKKITAVIVYMKYSRHFIPKQNKSLTYKHSIFVEKDWEGAILYQDDIYITHHPYGDCIIVI